MARYKTSQKYTVRIPFEDYEKLREMYGKNLASSLRGIIKRLLYEKQESKQVQPQLKIAQGYCNNPNCQYGNTPEKIRVLFDEKKQVWYCYNCHDIADVDEKTIKEAIKNG